MINRVKVIFLILTLSMLPCICFSTVNASCCASPNIKNIGAGILFCVNCRQGACCTDPGIFASSCGFWECASCGATGGSHDIVSEDGCVSTCSCGETIGEHDYELIDIRTETHVIGNSAYKINVSVKECTQCGDIKTFNDMDNGDTGIVTCPCQQCNAILGYTNTSFESCTECTSWCETCQQCLVHSSCTCYDIDYEECQHSYIQCDKPHCSEQYCMYCGSHSCDGDHNYITCSATHCGQKYCTKCGHTCGGGCTNTTCSEVHCKQYYCTRCGHICGGGHKSKGIWEVDGIRHVIYCAVNGCDYEFNSHTENFGDWRSEGELKHISTCQNGCNISKKENHIFNNIDNGKIKALDSGKTEYYTKHNVVCDKCEAQALYDHVDNNEDYVCDLCNVVLYNILYSPNVLTNKDVVATLNVYKPGQEVEIYKYTFTENGEYTFNITDPDYNVVAKVDWINKTLKGRIIYSPMKVTSEPVTVYFVPDFEGYNKEVFVSANGGTKVKVLQGGKYGYTMSENGTVEFSAIDSLGNGINLVANVSWIVSSDKTTISNTYYVMQGGTMFTNVLVKAEEEWSLSDIDNIDITIKEKATDKVIDNEIKTIMEVTNYYTRESIYNYETIPKGIYYIRLGIGGANVFEKGIYEVEIKGINNNSLHFTGKNKVEVEVYNLIDLT